MDADLAPIGLTDSLADQAYVRLRTAILAGALSPGEHLSVPELARRLGVSRSPVREAVLRLTREGLASANQNRGAIVASPSPDELRDAYAVRAALERLSASLAADRLQSEDLASLRQLLERHRTAVAEGDLGAHIATDLAFHLAIAHTARNDNLVAFLDQLMARIRIGIQRTGRSDVNRHRAFEDHAALLDAIEAGDDDSAGRLAYEHVQRVRNSLPENDNRY